MALTLTAMQQPERNLTFGAVVERLAAGRSNRELSRICAEANQKVSHSSIGDMRWGIVPGYRLLERFADGLALEPIDRRELFRTAGYERTLTMPLTEQEILERAYQIADEIVPTAEEEEEAGLQGNELMRYLGRGGTPHTIERVKRLLIASNRIRRQAEGRE